MSGATPPSAYTATVARLPTYEPMETRANGRGPGIPTHRERANGVASLRRVLDAVTLEVHTEAIARDGYTIVEDAIEPDLVDALRDDLLHLEELYAIGPSDNSFEGSRTVRIYNLLAFGRLYEAIPVHEHVLPLVESVLDPGCLVSSLSSIAILPGETAQPIHADDQLIPLDKPHAPTVCNSMWALTDFTEANGATRVIPGSHLADRSPDYGSPYDSVPAEMLKGSVLVWHGSLWHGGGANRTEQRRVGIAMNYCAGFIRQQENQQLGLPRDVVAGFSPRLRQLCGYGIYRGLIGHINKRDPVELLGEAPAGEMLFDVT
jgi:ectoine hydroxylase-related dioxygenase (phytanoyl-CoA dioxygenase family)